MHTKRLNCVSLQFIAFSSRDIPALLAKGSRFLLYRLLILDTVGQLYLNHEQGIKCNERLEGKPSSPKSPASC